MRHIPQPGSIQVRRIFRRAMVAVPEHLEQDARQEAWVGIMDAAKRWDGSTLFETYAHHRAHGQILDFLRRQDPLTREQRQKVRSGKDLELVFVPVKPWHAPAHYTLNPRVDIDRLMARVLPPRLRTIVGLRLREKTFPEIGRVCGVTAGRACQLYGVAVDKMRAAVMQ